MPLLPPRRDVVRAACQGFEHKIDLRPLLSEWQKIYEQSFNLFTQMRAEDAVGLYPDKTDLTQTEKDEACRRFGYLLGQRQCAANALKGPDSGFIKATVRRLRLEKEIPRDKRVYLGCNRQYKNVMERAGGLWDSEYQAWWFPTEADVPEGYGGYIEYIGPSANGEEDSGGEDED